MKEIYKDYLFEKHILVSDGETEEKYVFETLFAMAHFFGVKITKGRELVHCGMVKELSKRFGENVPKPFYRGFPQSVRNLSTEELLFDQLAHYFNTYGLGNFEEPAQSMFEKDFERAAFQEETEVQEFVIQTKEEAEETVRVIVKDLLSGSRPLSERQYTLVLTFIRDHLENPDIVSKNTCVRLLIDTKNLSLADSLNLSDVIKIVDELNYRSYHNDNPKKLNLKNQDRKFLTALLDRMFRGDRYDICTCYEKKQLWNGFLHHIHYQPKNEEAEIFVHAMRTKGNESVYSEFEKLMQENRCQQAAELLRVKKGTSALLRNMDYIISRMEQEEEQTFLSEFPEDCSTLILLQLLFRYEGVKRKNGRIFKFTQHNLMKVHYETPEESEKCQSRLTEEQVKEVGKMIRSKLSEKLRNRLLGKVYIEPSMKNYTLPLAENTLQGGLCVLSKGSRIPIDEGKKLRAFTYWEKVNDIDLSVFALTEDGNRREFSWRTMSRHQSGAITYSGDQTSGYLGGSEYFDINLPEFKTRYSEYRYLIFCDNVYSGKNFNECFCKAGYMLRDWDDSGQVYEPKTVKSAYLVNCESTFAYLFGIDLFTNEFVWLNVAKNSKSRVAGDTNLSFLTDYFHLTDVMNMYDFFSMMAEKIVEDPMEADVVVTDHEVKCTEEAQIIREYDFEKIRMLMEDAK